MAGEASSQGAVEQRCGSAGGRRSAVASGGKSAGARGGRADGRQLAARCRFWRRECWGELLDAGVPAAGGMRGARASCGAPDMRARRRSGSMQWRRTPKNLAVAANSALRSLARWHRRSLLSGGWRSSGISTSVFRPQQLGMGAGAQPAAGNGAAYLDEVAPASWTCGKWRRREAGKGRRTVSRRQDGGRASGTRWRRGRGMRRWERRCTSEKGKGRDRGRLEEPAARRGCALLSAVGDWPTGSPMRRRRWRWTGCCAAVLGLESDVGPTMYICVLGRAEVWRPPYLATLGPPPLRLWM